MFQLLFFFVCAVETQFKDVMLWVLLSRKKYPQQKLIKLYTSRYGLIYPKTTPSIIHPFYLVTHPDGSHENCPFVLFQKRELVVAHALRELAELRELPIRTLESEYQIPPKASGVRKPKARAYMYDNGDDEYIEEDEEEEENNFAPTKQKARRKKREDDDPDFVLDGITSKLQNLNYSTM